MKYAFAFLIIFIHVNSYADEAVSTTLNLVKEVDQMKKPLESLDLERWEVAHINISLSQKLGRVPNSREVTEALVLYLRNEKGRVVPPDNDELKMLSVSMTSISKKFNDFSKQLPLYEDEKRKLDPKGKEYADLFTKKMIEGAPSDIFAHMQRAMFLSQKMGFSSNDLIKIVREVKSNVKSAERNNSFIDYKAIVKGQLAERNLKSNDEATINEISEELAIVSGYAKSKEQEVRKEMAAGVPSKIRNVQRKGSK